MPRVLLVSFFFPPSNVVGAIRAAKLAKYLPAHGWQPTVVTVDRFRSRPQTLSLEEPVPRLVRARYVDPVGALLSWRRGNAGPQGVTGGSGGGGPSVAGRLRELLRKAPGISSLHVPDRAMPWYGPAVAAGLRALRQTPHDVLFSTAPPPTTHLVAATLSRLTGIPWVADMRDLWSTFPSDEMGPWRRRMETVIERGCLRSAARLTTVSAPMVDDLAELHSQPVHVVTNGFDPADVAASAPAPLDRLTLTYTGSLVPRYRDPEPLLAGIALLRDRRGLAPGEVDVRFYGSEHETVPPLVARYDVGDFVRFRGLVSRDESLARQRESAALLVFDWNAPQERGVMTLKALEYLQAQRPILVVGRRSDSYLIRRLREAGVGVACASPEDVADTLERWLDEFGRRGVLPYHGDEQVIGRYRWDRLAGELAGIFERTAS